VCFLCEINLKFFGKQYTKRNLKLYDGLQKRDKINLFFIAFLCAIIKNSNKWKYNKQNKPHLHGRLLMIKKALKTAVPVIAAFLILLAISSPDRGSFNHTVFEGGSNSITANTEIRNDIMETNRKDYNNDNHPYTQRKNYVLFSIYDIHARDAKEYHVLGILQLFMLING
jgi:hypothetical protein